MMSISDGLVARTAWTLVAVLRSIARQCLGVVFAQEVGALLAERVLFCSRLLGLLDVARNAMLYMHAEHFLSSFDKLGR